MRRAPPGLEPGRSQSRAAPALRAATNAAAAAQVVSGGRARSLGEPLAPAGDALVGTVTHRFDPNWPPSSRASALVTPQTLLHPPIAPDGRNRFDASSHAAAGVVPIRETWRHVEPDRSPLEVVLALCCGAPPPSPGRRRAQRRAHGLVERRECRVQAEHRRRGDLELEDIKPDYRSGRPRRVRRHALRDGRRVLVRRAPDFAEIGRPPSTGSLLPNECSGTL